MNPPELKPLKEGKSLILYLAIEGNAIRVILAQEEVMKMEHTIYYFSKKMLPYEKKYSEVEQIFLAMVWAIR